VPKQKTAGQKCNAPVEFVDVYPTLADLCGLPKPTGLPGSSLKPFIENPATPMAKVAISQYPRSAGQAGAVMGYSIRDERWRATFWRERNGTKIVATELYDEQNDPAETVSLHDRPEHQTLLATLAKNLPPVGSSTPGDDAKSQGKGKNGKAAAAAPAAVPASNDERNARFDKLDVGKSGKLSREYYTTNQSDAAAAAERFTKWDKDKDGFLTREEFLKMGK
jgi:arylsulfatase A-like enzyme